jgi:hypothetical protein
LSDGCETPPPALGNRGQIKGSSYELVVVHPLPVCSNAGPWRKVVGVPLAMIELTQSIIIRIEVESDLKTLAELGRKIVIGPRDVDEILWA